MMSAVSRVRRSAALRRRGPAAPCAASSGAGRAPRRCGARTPPSRARCARHRRAGARGLEVSPRGLRQDLLVQGQVRDRLAQPRVLRFQLLQPLHLVRLQAPELPPPAVVGHFRHADRADRLRHRLPLRHQDIHLPQLGHGLLRPVLLARHLGPPPVRTHTSGRTASEGEDQAERRAHDYKRHGTLDLFAALDVKAGTVIGACKGRHRAVEFRAFLDQVEAAVPADLEVHLVLDNLKTHRTRSVHDWLVKRPRWRLHFTPTSASWLNLVECWFALLSRRRLERGAFTSVGDLEAAIHAYIADTNADPKPFAWTKTADDILASVARFCQRTSNSGHLAGLQ